MTKMKLTRGLCLDVKSLNVGKLGKIHSPCVFNKANAAEPSLSVFVHNLFICHFVMKYADSEDFCTKRGSHDALCPCRNILETLFFKRKLQFYFHNQYLMTICVCQSDPHTVSLNFLRKSRVIYSKMFHLQSSISFQRAENKQVCSLKFNIAFGLRFYCTIIVIIIFLLRANTCVTKAICF